MVSYNHLKLTWSGTEKRNEKKKKILNIEKSNMGKMKMETKVSDRKEKDEKQKR